MEEVEPAAKKQKLEEKDDGKDHVTSADKCISESMDEATFLLEEDVGIQQYISPLPGFHGVIKQRYSDFIVNEIDISGQVVHLTSKDYVPEVKPAVEPPDSTSGGADKITKSDLQQQAVDGGILTESDVQQLQSLVSSTDKKPFYILKSEKVEDKEFRTQIHNAIRNCFTGLDSTTTECEGQKVIRVAKAADGRSKKRYPNNWPADRGDYCKFVLYKTAKDTMNAIFLISKMLRVNRSLFHYAGTKDRRAKTTQEITAYRISAEKLAGLNQRLREIVLGNFRYVDKQMQLGQLKGNEFTIVLRNVKGDNDLVDKAMTSLRDVGFINYYGMQRFGTSTIPTHHVGRALLQNDYKEAADLILKPRPGENEFVTNARKVWTETRNAKEMLSKMPRRFTIETALLEGLVHEGVKNYCNAFIKIPRTTRLMYVHSYQSYVWNSVVSLRIKKYGLKPIVGDLVQPKECDTELSDDEDDMDYSDRFTKVNDLVAALDEDSVSKFTIHDVVMPLPGYAVKYPDNEVGSWYKSMLAEDKLSSEALNHKNKQFALKGAYRKILVQPTDVTWQTYMYKDVTRNLALSDLDRLENVPEPQSEQDGEFKALKIQMKLPSSCYATMAIREVLKCDTSSAFQSKMNESGQTGTEETESELLQSGNDKT